MSYHMDEISTQNGNPIEMYLFSYAGQNYQYTTAQYPQEFNVGDTYYVFSPEYIKRGPSLKLGDSGGTIETCTITVSRTNSVALLYQGAPPELGEIRCQIYRCHGQNNIDFIKILDGIVSQVRFKDSEAELTITIENALNRYIPRGILSYHCQNCIYDEKCTLNAPDYAIQCESVGDRSGLTIYSYQLLDIPPGYLDYGGMQMGNCLRAIVHHQDNWIRIKYPINKADRQLLFTVYPGCGNLFKVCAEKFNNTVNFNGIPYQQPYDAFKHPVDKGAYWIDSEVIIRNSHGVIYDGPHNG